MKLLLVLAVVLAGIWLWRNARRNRSEDPRPPPGGPKGAPHDMVRCAVCQVYLPRDLAIAGPGGPYCSQEHRLHAGKKGP